MPDLPEPLTLGGLVLADVALARLYALCAARHEALVRALPANN
ncbi:hypothetical protein UFOVP411_45 [uncultured Caudovirales phage]|uniref:Uncharacterized protein n=1 Tax=uncultured Caudovirales phage TaxID=2100421 RepID=A0A6J5M7I7_9CAUD|nr:hypothetical protein UFOVP411_45 [uncultured Caudovirales phage]